ncbi:TetR/AcrR family transcriptional regulator [Lacticaseibacillus parakribbianus]|uniref:TetR/AcrR family transcriptional regulator n=1 Tax=Lacticaseibacillus parakribbianus TaxID=2970927 RepID=UPI0021CB1C52|nr:TetR/AcrR family transcriptional regulator [Lacticaseibacillus parakribbianus]
MVSTTFMNLAQPKKARVTQALLQEFSAHPLAEAQVARIVTAAGIARGAFYKYFTDLTDAYQYLFGQAMRAIHAGLPGQGSAADYVAATRAFLDSVQDSEYGALIQQHFRANESVLGNRPSALAETPSAWAVAVLCHQTIKDVILAPDTQAARLQQLAAAVAKIRR